MRWPGPLPRPGCAGAGIFDARPGWGRCDRGGRSRRGCRFRRVGRRSGIDLRQRSGVGRCRNFGVDQDDGRQVQRVIALHDAARGGGNLDVFRWGGDRGRLGVVCGGIRCRRGDAVFLHVCQFGFGQRGGFDRLGFGRDGQRRAVFHQQAQTRIEGGAAYAALHPALRGIELIRAETEHAGAFRAGGAVIHFLIPASRTQPSSTAGGSKTNPSR